MQSTPEHADWRKPAAAEAHVDAPGAARQRTVGAERHVYRGYAAAILSVAGATLFRWLLSPLVSSHAPYIPYFMAIVLTAWFGGFRPAILAVGLSAVAVIVVFLPPIGSLGVTDPADWFSVGLFVAAGIGIAAIGGRQRASRCQAEANAALAAREAEERRRVEEALRLRMAEIETLMDTLPVAVFLAHDTACQRITANRVGYRLMRLDEGTNISLSAAASEKPTSFRAFHNGREVALDELPMQHAAAHGVEVRDAEIEHVYDDGVMVSLYGHASPLYDEAGRLRGAIGVFVDVSERRRAEQDLLSHKMEIELLNTRLRHALRETHHRVKNNLQVITAMVDMRVMEGAPAVPTSELARLGSQVQALATVHDLLTHDAGAGGEASDLSARQLLGRLLGSFRDTAAPSAVTYALDDVVLPARQATSLALVANELISNALKHGGSGVAVRLRVVRGTAALVVCDDGPGFPPGFDPQAAARTGLDLVANLVRWDLQGRVRYGARRGGGGRVAVLFRPGSEGEPVGATELGVPVPRG